MKESLNELTNEMREINEEIHALSTLELDTEDAEKALAIVKNRIGKKVENIDHVITSMDMTRDALIARAGIYEKEAANLKRRAESMEKNKKRLYEHLVNAGLIVEKSPLRTSAHTYFIQNKPGSLVIADDAVIPAKYIKTKIEQLVDKDSLRKAVIAGEEFAGISISPTKTVVRR